MKHWWRSWGGKAWRLGRWALFGAALGVVCGLAGAAFHAAVSSVTALRGAQPWVIWLLPLGGAAVAALYSLTRQHGVGTTAVVAAAQDSGDVPALLAPTIFAGAVLTHFVGGSAGREGAALQIGGSLASTASRALHFSASERSIAVLCGMAAVFSALFGTPVGAAVFVLEMTCVGALRYDALLPCAIASGAAYAVTQALGIEATRFAVPMPELSLGLTLRAAVLAALCALLSVGVCAAYHKTEHLAAHAIPKPVLRAVVGGCAVLALTLLFGTDYNGAGEPIFRRALETGECAPEAFALKLLFTAVSLGFGFRGGEVVPTFFIGATFGCTVGPLLGIPAPFAAAIGLTATFCGASNCPLGTLLLALELFGGGRAEVFALVCAVSYVLSGVGGLYPNQRFLYPKGYAE